MRIVCPACETAYDVPDAAVAPGRAMRCARCRSEWVPGVAAPAEAVAAPASDAASGTDAAPPHPVAPHPVAPPVARAAPPLAATRPAGPRVAVIAGWLVSFLLLGGMGYAALAWRQPIEHAWPPSVRAYAWLGYP